MRNKTLKRYISIQDRFKHLFETERVRYDDCVQRIAEEYFISEGTVHKILTKVLTSPQTS